MTWNVSVSGREAPVLADDEGSGLVAILAHGAGSHMEQKTLDWLAGIVRQSGARVVRFNFLHRAEGRGMPDRMPVLVETYRAVISSVLERLTPDRLVIGGHSMGGRVATMLEAEGRHADGLLLFGYPLHPAGQPDKLRDAHLPSIQTPALQFSGTEDALCTRALMEAVPVPPSWSIHWLEGADHSYAIKKSTGRTRADLAHEMQAALTTWLAQLS